MITDDVIGYIYMLRESSSSPGEYKVVKCTNFEKTLQTYGRIGNIKQASWKIYQYVDYIEALIMNILAPYRIVRCDKIKLSEKVKLEKCLLQFIIGWVINHVNYFGIEIEKIPIIRSVNTIKIHRCLITGKIWDSLYDDLSQHFLGDSAMEIDKENMYYNKDDFDELMSRIIKYI